jgi:hypothetical protein
MRCNVQSLLQPPLKVTPSLITRHTIVATLQLWLTVRHPICPLRQVLCAGTPRDASALDDFSQAAGWSSTVKSWASPSALTATLCVLGDVCAPAWPTGRSQPDQVRACLPVSHFLAHTNTGLGGFPTASRVLPQCRCCRLVTCASRWKQPHALSCGSSRRLCMYAVCRTAGWCRRRSCGACRGCCRARRIWAGSSSPSCST